LVHDRTAHVQLLRLLLRSAAQGDDNQRQRVTEAIDAVGQKQIVAETFLVVSMAIVATALLIEKTGGKTRQSTETIIEELPDGSRRVTVREEVVYADAGSALGKLFGWLGKLPFK
jgi:hypothetical protein